MAWKQGDTLQGGKYAIEKVLGEGGFGITYKARHVMFDEWVVIKTPNSSLQKDPEYSKFVQRFIKEAQTLARLGKTRHPHIVRVSDLFKEGSLPCLVMDFIEGESLLDIVQRNC